MPTLQRRRGRAQNQRNRFRLSPSNRRGLATRLFRRFVAQLPGDRTHFLVTLILDAERQRPGLLRFAGVDQRDDGISGLRKSFSDLVKFPELAGQARIVAVAFQQPAHECVYILAALVDILLPCLLIGPLCYCHHAQQRCPHLVLFGTKRQQILGVGEAHLIEVFL